MPHGIFIIYYFFFGTGGFKEGVLPGVSLLSRCLRSGFPVESAVLFGPGLSAIIFNCLKCLIK